MEIWRLGHRPALDGLRGIAIIGVLVSHASHGLLSGFGTAGVYLFFVLSGFLITALLLEERRDTGRVDVSAFYARRARRLLPALFVSTLVVVVVGSLLGDWWGSGWDVAAVMLYVANWVPAFGGDLQAFGTTWTLGVEEQFYLIWPLLLIVTRFRAMLLAVALGLASWLWAAHLLSGGASAVRVAVGTDTVALVLLAGVFVAALRTTGGPGRARPWLTVVGVLGLVLASAPALWQSWLLNVPLAAAAAGVAVYAVTGAGRAPMFEGRVLRWFGSRSYGIYLWQGPLLWAMREHYDLSSWWLALVGVPASLLVSEASYRWVEAPFRARRVRSAVTAGASGTATPQALRPELPGEEVAPPSNGVTVDRPTRDARVLSVGTPSAADPQGGRDARLSRE